jgi:hypothetical protein
MGRGFTCCFYFEFEGTGKHQIAFTLEELEDAANCYQKRLNIREKIERYLDSL